MCVWRDEPHVPDKDICVFVCVCVFLSVWCCNAVYCCNLVVQMLHCAIALSQVLLAPAAASPPTQQAVPPPSKMPPIWVGRWTLCTGDRNPVGRIHALQNVLTQQRPPYCWATSPRRAHCSAHCRRPITGAAAPATIPIRDACPRAYQAAAPSRIAGTRANSPASRQAAVSCRKTSSVS